MTESNKKKKYQENQKLQPSDETKTELREISDEELKRILEEHKKWLESDGKKGKKADLSKAILSHVNLQQVVLNEANLQDADLEKSNLQEALLGGANLQKANLLEANLQNANLGVANLQHANLVKANLQKAYLMEANLEGANLVGANLKEAHLYKADMRKTFLGVVKGLSEANLQYANLQGATGLLGDEFAQAYLTGTKLPKNIEEFKALETVEKTSQNARKIFFAMLLGCVYSWLTIATTTDVRLLTNTASSPLPIIQTEIPIAGFYWAAPLLLICLYFYFHLYLLKLWESLSGLPAIFPDGKRLDERAYPWLLNGLVRRHFMRLKADRPFIAHIQEWITIFLAWWVVPITMIAFWLRFIPRHDWVGTIFHIGLIVISVAFTIYFYRLCALILQGKNKEDFILQKFWGDKRFYCGVSVAMIAVLFSLLSYGAIEGLHQSTRMNISKMPIGFVTKIESIKFNIMDIKQTVPLAFEKVGYSVFADFREKSVSEKPDRYWEIAENDLTKYIKGANLKSRNLKNADMYDSFLVKADLRGALLNGATLQNANLQEANLEEANLQKAILAGALLQQAQLTKANLKEATLEDANLEGTHLAKANLQKTILVGTILQKAKLEGANLQEANLTVALLQEAKLREANLQKALLWEARLQQAQLTQANLQEAILNGAHLQKAILNKADLQEAVLAGANLQEAILTGAILQKTNLEEATLQQANLFMADLTDSILEKADLTGAKNLTIEQLSKVKTLYKAKLDPDLMEQVKKCCPHLLEKPKEEIGQTN